MQMKENEGKSWIYRPITYIISPSYVYIQKNIFNFIELWIWFPYKQASFTLCTKQSPLCRVETHPPPPPKKKKCQLFYFADFTQKLPALVKICLFLLIFRCLLIRVILRHLFSAYSIFLYECVLNSYNNELEYGNSNIWKRWRTFGSIHLTYPWVQFPEQTNDYCPKIKEYMDQLLFKISLRYLILAISLLIF